MTHHIDHYSVHDLHNWLTCVQNEVGAWMSFVSPSDIWTEKLTHRLEHMVEYVGNMSLDDDASNTTRNIVLARVNELKNVFMFVKEARENV